MSPVLFGSVLSLTVVYNRPTHDSYLVSVFVVTFLKNIVFLAQIWQTLPVLFL